MNRRHFIAASCAASLATITSNSLAGQSNQRDFYELRHYIIETEEQRNRIDTYFRDAAFEAYNKIDINPVGVFYPNEGPGPVYVLLRHNNLESFASATDKLLSDSNFTKKASDFLDTPSSNPAYLRIEIQLLAAFKKMPKLEIPTKAATRIFQLRTYESHSVRAGRTKIEMFNNGEIDIFRKTGLNPVFFGESLAGTLMPNLTYMLGFDDMDQSTTNWSNFIKDPDWKKLSVIPEYSDRLIVSNITNTYLKPAPYSQI
jgi:hypothetical protein